MIDARCRGLGVLGKVVVERGEVLADEDPHLLLVVADRLLPASTPLGPRLGGSRPRLRKLGLQLLALPAHIVTGECAPFEFGERDRSVRRPLVRLPLLAVDRFNAIAQGISLGDQRRQFRAHL